MGRIAEMENLQKRRSVTCLLQITHAKPTLTLAKIILAQSRIVP